MFGFQTPLQSGNLLKRSQSEAVGARFKAGSSAKLEAAKSRLSPERHERKAPKKPGRSMPRLLNAARPPVKTFVSYQGHLHQRSVDTGLAVYY